MGTLKSTRTRTRRPSSSGRSSKSGEPGRVVRRRGVRDGHEGREGPARSGLRAVPADPTRAIHDRGDGSAQPHS